MLSVCTGDDDDGVESGADRATKNGYATKRTGSLHGWLTVDEI